LFAAAGRDYTQFGSNQPAQSLAFTGESKFNNNPALALPGIA
jgi:hypothetical protein